MNIKTIIAALTIAFSANTAAIDVGAVKDASCADKLAASIVRPTTTDFGFSNLLS